MFKFIEFEGEQAMHADFNELLKAEGLDHFIGHVSFKVVGDELRVYPDTDYSREYIGENDYLGFKI